MHPNTLRQRLRRIADLTQIDVRTDDWLMIEIALKLLKLEEVYPPGHHTWMTDFRDRSARRRGRTTWQQ